jgi:hypothetical protein
LRDTFSAACFTNDSLYTVQLGMKRIELSCFCKPRASYYNNLVYLFCNGGVYYDDYIEFNVVKVTSFAKYMCSCVISCGFKRNVVFYLYIMNSDHCIQFEVSLGY